MHGWIGLDGLNGSEGLNGLDGLNGSADGLNVLFLLFKFELQTFFLLFKLDGWNELMDWMNGWIG